MVSKNNKHSIKSQPYKYPTMVLNTLPTSIGPNLPLFEKSYYGLYFEWNGVDDGFCLGILDWVSYPDVGIIIDLAALASLAPW